MAQGGIYRAAVRPSGSDGRVARFSRSMRLSVARVLQPSSCSSSSLRRPSLFSASLSSKPLSWESLSLEQQLWGSLWSWPSAAPSSTKPFAAAFGIKVPALRELLLASLHKLLKLSVSLQKPRRLFPRSRAAPHSTPPRVSLLHWLRTSNAREFLSRLSSKSRAWHGHCRSALRVRRASVPRAAYDSRLRGVRASIRNIWPRPLRAS